MASREAIAIKRDQAVIRLVAALMKRNVVLDMTKRFRNPDEEFADVIERIALAVETLPVPPEDSGEIADVEISEEPLSPEQVAEDYEMGVQVTHTSVVIGDVPDKKGKGKK